MLVHYAYFFTFSFFSETPVNGCFPSVILMAANAASLTKHSVVPTFEKTGVRFRSTLR